MSSVTIEPKMFPLAESAHLKRSLTPEDVITCLPPAYALSARCRPRGSGERYRAVHAPPR